MEKTNPVDVATKSLRSDSELARRLGIARTSVFRWRQAGRIPTERLIDVSKVTGVPIRLLDETACQIFEVMKAQEASH